MLNRYVGTLLAASFALLLAGCIGGATPPSQFYLLEPIDRRESAASDLAEKPIVALGPVRIPHYVDRPQIVTASGKNSYRLSELHRWAESLDANISRVLAQNLTQLASIDTLPVNDSKRAREAELRVAVTFLEFHVNPEGQAGLTAQWQILRGDHAISNRQVSYRAPASTTDYTVMVAVLNDCLNRMSRDLALALRQALAEAKKT